MPYLKNGTFAESQEEYVLRLLRQARQEAQKIECKNLDQQVRLGVHLEQAEYILWDLVE